MHSTLAHLAGANGGFVMHGASVITFSTLILGLHFIVCTNDVLRLCNVNVIGLKGNINDTKSHQGNWFNSYGPRKAKHPKCYLDNYICSVRSCLLGPHFRNWPTMYRFIFILSWNVRAETLPFCKLTVQWKLSSFRAWTQQQALRGWPITATLCFSFFLSFCDFGESRSFFFACWCGQSRCEWVCRRGPAAAACARSEKEEKSWWWVQCERGPPRSRLTTQEWQSGPERTKTVSWTFCSATAGSEWPPNLPEKRWLWRPRRRWVDRGATTGTITTLLRACGMACRTETIQDPPWGSLAAVKTNSWTRVMWVGVAAAVPDGRAPVVINTTATTVWTARESTRITAQALTLGAPVPAMVVQGPASDRDKGTSPSAWKAPPKLCGKSELSSKSLAGWGSASRGAERTGCPFSSPKSSRDSPQTRAGLSGWATRSCRWTGMTSGRQRTTWRCRRLRRRAKKWRWRVSWPTRERGLGKAAIRGCLPLTAQLSSYYWTTEAHQTHTKSKFNLKLPHFSERSQTIGRKLTLI